MESSSSIGSEQQVLLSEVLSRLWFEMRYRSDFQAPLEYSAGNDIDLKQQMRISHLRTLLIAFCIGRGVKPVSIEASAKSARFVNDPAQDNEFSIPISTAKAFATSLKEEIFFDPIDGWSNDGAKVSIIRVAPSKTASPRTKKTARPSAKKWGKKLIKQPRTIGPDFDAPKEVVEAYESEVRQEKLQAWMKKIPGKLPKRRMPLLAVQTA